ncbi:MAG TPA: hypothetical protein DDZ69_11740 [Porphyromonadaceae bacterium]|jgi:hypothetical protein|nr:hypothetical protein [Porphyromonadaceae bacterium]
MAVTKIRKTSSLAFLSTIIVTLVVLGLFLFGGQVAPEQKLVPDMSQPIFTDMLLYWAYALLAITIVALIIFAIFGFLHSMKVNPKGAIRGLLVLVAMVVILGISYTLGSGEILNIPGYDGGDNNPGTLKVVDMWLLTTYFMLFITVAAVLISPLLSKRK